MDVGDIFNGELDVNARIEGIMEAADVKSGAKFVGNSDFWGNVVLWRV